MSELIRITEQTAFGGVAVPNVPTFEDVDLVALTDGDESPFFVTMAVMEAGRVSRNGLEYDAQLVGWVEDQIREKRPDALMGHLSDERDSAFPVSPSAGDTPFAGWWIGALQEGAILWAKAYIPDGDVRDYIRGKKAIRGTLGTSIYGRGETTNTNGVRRLTNFTLETLDFVPLDRASLQMSGAFAITSEMVEGTEEVTPMPNELNISDDVRRQIREEALREARLETSTQRVAELERTISESAQRISELEATVSQQAEEIAESRRYVEIVGEIRSYLSADSDADAVDIVRQMHTILENLASTLNVDSSHLEITVNELHMNIRELREKAHAAAVDAAVAELTDWNATTDVGKQRLTAFRNQFTRAVQAELADTADEAAIAEAVKRVYEGDFQLLAEALRDDLTGPAAVVAGQSTAEQSTREYYKTEEGAEHLRRMWR